MPRYIALALCTLGLAGFAACGGGDSATGGNTLAPKRASLTVNINNVPEGTTAIVTVTGPNGFSRPLAGTTTITDLTPGSYAVLAGDAETETARYGALPATQNVELAAGTTRTVDITYGIASATLQLTISGLPPGTLAAVAMTGPNNFARQFTASEAVTKLVPGSYTLSAAQVTAAGDGYAAPNATQTIEISAGIAPFVYSIQYAIATGRLQIMTNGLPTGVTPSIQVSGPDGYSRTANAGEVLLGLKPGTYSLVSPNVTIDGNTYSPTAPSVTASVSASAVPVQPTVTYAFAGGSGANLTIENVYITQAVQTLNGDVPLVAGRDGLVRVFVKANAANTLRPQVRVRLYNGTTLLNTLTLNAPTGSVPTTVSDLSLTSAWYGAVAGSLIQPGLRILADVDPGNAIGEQVESDNNWPASGTAALVVKSVAPVSIRFVPIKQSNDLTGNVTSANTPGFLNDIRRMFPVGTIDADVRATYTSNSGVVQSDDGNGAWNAVLNEINALRAIDGSSRYYYGVLRTTYSSGVAGMGYLGAPAAIGWDYLPSGADVMAHELGHNWGRYHAPCGGAGSPDPAYPYAGGRIGVSGYDLTTGLFKAATMPDVMGYCVPTWVSDFTYKGIMSYREYSPSIAAARVRAPEPGVLVWGRIVGNDVILEPAFEIVAAPSLPVVSGANRIDGLAEDGSVLFSYAFDGDVVDHANPEDRHFAFVVPQTALRGRALATLRLRARGRSVEQRSTTSLTTISPSVRRTPSGVTRVTWSDRAVRGVLIRDARTGDVLSIARGGVANFEAHGDLELVVSDGVRSQTRRVAIDKR